MVRLSDQPEPYAVLIIVPKDGPGEAAVTHTINGRLARMIAWLLDHRLQVEHMRGSLSFNFGPKITETFPHEAVMRSAELSPDG